MKIRLVSDVHTEFHKDGGRAFVDSIPDDCDVLIIAGDLGVTSNLLAVLRWLTKRFKHVVYVVGNHEYYQSSPLKATLAISKCVHHANESGPGKIYWLRENTVKIDGVTFGGTTLWFRENPNNIWFENRLNDFKVIGGFKPWVYDENKKALEFLATADVDIMVSHHLPHGRSIPERFKGDPLNAFYVCDVTPEITRMQPRLKLWMHGHTHDTQDYMLGDTRVLCNPYGYEGHLLNNEFDRSLLIEL
jgi:predicted phosphodiesterase